MLASLNAIPEAAHAQKLLRITYVDGKNVQSVRTVEPYEVKNGKLFAWCIQRNGIRAFKLSNIFSVEVLPRTFVARFPIQIPQVISVE